jgi:hypothetical protein
MSLRSCGLPARNDGIARFSDLRAKTNLSNRIKAIWVVQSPSQKYFLFSSDPNHFYIPRHPGPLEGRFAIVTNVGQGCGGRGCALGERREADGEVVWS